MNNYLENKKRIEKQAAAAIRAQLDAKKLNEEMEQKEADRKFMENAALTYGSSIHRNKQKIKNLVESIEYRDRISKSVMIDFLTEAAEKALLIDINEYAKLNPEYRNDIRNLVTSFMENVNLNESIKVDETLALIEHIGRRMPDVRTGILLTEDQLKNAMSNKDMDEILDKLSNKISHKVATIVSKEKEAKAEIQDDVAAATQDVNAPMDPNMAAQEPQIDQNMMAQQNMDPNMVAQMAQTPMDPNMIGQQNMDPNAQMMDPNMAAQMAPEPIQPMEQPDMEVPQGGDPSMMQAPEMPPVQEPQFSSISDVIKAFERKEIDLDTANAAITQLQAMKDENINPDGSLNDAARAEAIDFVISSVNESAPIEKEVKISKTPKFIQSTPKTGLLETLAVNEGLKMINENREYNGDLALANAITYVTVLETFNQAGLIEIGEAQYKKFVTSAGGRY